MPDYFGKDTKKLGFGLMRLPRKLLGTDIEETKRMVDLFMEAGFTYFDTAYVYPGSEEAIKKALVERYPRDSYTLTTKLNAFMMAPNEKAAKQQLFTSLERTGAGYFDYYLLHALMENNYKKYDRYHLWDYAAEMKEKGIIKHYGFSFHGDVAVFDWALAHHDEYHWDFVQIQANYVDWNNEEDKGRSGKYLYEELEKRGIPAVIMEPLLGGRLSKVPDHVVAHFKQRKPEDSVASWAFRYIGSKPNILTVLSGMTYMEHLEDNLRTYSPLDPLTEEEQQWLEGETATLIKSYPTIDCNDCKYCMPCPYGLDIPGIFVHYNKCVNQGNVPESQQAENYRKARRAFLVGYDRSVPRLRQASHCIQCRECVSHCPQQIDIPRELQRVDAFVEKLKQGTL